MLLPWLMFFGVSGLLFNHPNLGEDVRGVPITSHELEVDHGLLAWQPRDLSERLIGELNRHPLHTKYAPYSIDPGFEPALQGVALYAAPSTRGREMLMLDMSKPAGVLVSRGARRTDPESFGSFAVELPGVSTLSMEAQLAGLLERHDAGATGPLRAHARIAPELRMRVRDRVGQSWNLTYDTRSFELTGRRTDSFPAIGLTQFLATLHTTHHFPARVSATWCWVLFEDLLGATMVFWAFSGAAMWWQIKATRRAGIVSLSVALAVALAIMTGTAAEVFFGDVRQKMGPGE